jgi:hypothetical protein
MYVAGTTGKAGVQTLAGQDRRPLPCAQEMRWRPETRGRCKLGLMSFGCSLDQVDQEVPYPLPLCPPLQALSYMYSFSKHGLSTCMCHRNGAEAWGPLMN